jgi:transcriptional regulator with XRE-family HTH domain
MRPEDREHLGAALAVLRSILGWDQAEVARAGGIPPSSVSDYERGKVIPSPRTLAKILSGMSLPPVALETALGCVRTVRALGKGGPHAAAEPAAASSARPAGFDRALTTLVRASRTAARKRPA